MRGEHKKEITASGSLVTQYEYLSLPYRQYHRALALVDVDRLHFVQVQLFRNRQRPSRTFHLERSIRSTTTSNPASHRVSLTLKSHAGKRDKAKPFLSMLVRFVILLVIGRTHVLQPYRVTKVHREQRPLSLWRLICVLVLIHLVRHADYFERHAHVPHSHHRVVRVRSCVCRVQGNGEVVLRKHVLRHVHMRVVLREEHHRAAKSWNRGQGWPPLSHEMGTLWILQLVAPWVWWVVYVSGGCGIF